MTSSVENNAHTASNQAHHHKNERGNSKNVADMFSQYMDQFRKHGTATKINGGDGDDTIDASGYRSKINGGAGNDTITATGSGLEVNGGSGDDVIDVRGVGFAAFGYLHVPHHMWGAMHQNSDLIDSGDAGSSDDGDMNTHHHSAHMHFHPLEFVLFTRPAQVDGGAGDDKIDINSGTVFGGSGNDEISNTSGSSRLMGGAGDDVLSSTGRLNINSKIIGGAGDDTIYASGTHLNIMGGTGNDSLTLDGSDDLDLMRPDYDGQFYPIASGLSTLNGGLGDDHLKMVESAQGIIEYYAGDGHDTVDGARENSTLKLGEGLMFSDTTFTLDGDNLTMGFSGSEGSITFVNYASKGLPMVEYTNGRTLDASTIIAFAGGNPSDYTVGEGATDTSSDTQDQDHSSDQGEDHEDQGN